MRHSTLLAALALTLGLAGCPTTPGTPPVDAARDDTGGNDAAMPVDAGVDTGGSDVDAFVADTGVDSGGGTDAGGDVDSGGGSDAGGDPCAPHTFVVETPGSVYTFDGSAANPTLTLCRGTTYMFDLSAVPGFHPMQITSAGSLLMALPGGVTTSYTIPSTAPLPDAYSCSIHGFGGAIMVP